MTNANQTGSLIKINNRLQYIRGVVSLTKTGTYTWEIKTEQGYTFKAFGGKKAGGSSRDWFVEQTEESKKDYVVFDQAINCKSLVDAIRTVAVV